MKKMSLFSAVILLLLLMNSCEPPITWIDVTTFANGWANYPVSGYPKVQYGKDSWGQVHIRGFAVDNAGLSTSSTIFTLPADYAPYNETVFAVALHSGGLSYVGELYIRPSGNMDVSYSATIQNVDFGEIIYNR